MACIIIFQCPVFQNPVLKAYWLFIPKFVINYKKDDKMFVQGVKKKKHQKTPQLAAHCSAVYTFMATS